MDERTERENVLLGKIRELADDCVDEVEGLIDDLLRAREAPHELYEAAIRVSESAFTAV
jgi:hypothetical protein